MTDGLPAEDASDEPAVTQPDIYVILTGVSGNLGDAVIRRRVLEWSRGLGTIHAYVGNTTPGWIEQLGLREDEHVYAANARKRWITALMFGRGRRVLVLDPGEVPLGREHLKSELVFLLMVLIVRVRRGLVFRPPRAVGDYDRLVGAIYRLSSRLSHFVLWRDQTSLERIGIGDLVPDTAFAEPVQSGEPPHQRQTLLISMRGKRPFPPPQWFAAVKNFAATQGLRVAVASQVDEDETRSRDIADRLGHDIAHHVPWGARSDLEQERMMRALYEECTVVISDRLHVLILAAQAGAQPVELASRPRPKVATHFATIGMADVSFDVERAETSGIVEFLEQQSPRRGELTTRMSAARTELNQYVDAFRTAAIELHRTGAKPSSNGSPSR